MQVWQGQRLYFFRGCPPSVGWVDLSKMGGRGRAGCCHQEQRKWGEGADCCHQKHKRQGGCPLTLSTSFWRRLHFSTLSSSSLNILQELQNSRKTSSPKKPTQPREERARANARVPAARQH